MIWYITIATVFLFQNGRVMCNESAPSGRDRFAIELKDVHYMVIINKVQPEYNTIKFLCNGVSIHNNFIVTVSTCVNKNTDVNLIFTEAGNAMEGDPRFSKVNGILRPRGQDKNIALLFTSKPLTRPDQLMLLPEFAFAAIPGSNIDIICCMLNHTLFDVSITGLRKVSAKIVDKKTARNPSVFSFAANNSNNLLNMDDIGCAALHNGIFVGLLLHVGKEIPAVFEDIYSSRDFI